MSLSVRRGARFLASSALSLSLLAPPLASSRADDGPPPPALVGRLGTLAGSVSFHQAGADGWTQATINQPVSSGDAVFAEAGSHAEIEAGTDLFALDGGSELDVATLAQAQIAASEPQGRLFAAIGPLPTDAAVTVATPRGTVTLEAGTYEIAAGDSLIPTLVTVVSGSARIATTGLSLRVGPGETATLNGTDQIAGGVAPSPPADGFLAAMLTALARFRNATLPANVAGMTGCQALAGTGRWTPTAQYGQVWYPPVQAGWVPYREGHWAYVAPWGWTWIDDEPWGFAPFHYGRWAQIDGSWAWIPGDDTPVYDGVPEPVYAPALVGWTDAGEGLIVGAAIGALASGAIGWIPLGPGEPYVPPYRYDRRYFDRLNRMNVRDIGRIDPAHAWGGRNFGGFRNRGAATLVSANVLRDGAPVRASARGFDPAAFGARPIAGRHVLGSPGANASGPASRGPEFVSGAFHPASLGGQRLPFRGAPATVGPGPGPGHVAGAGAGLPGLRPHDQVESGRPGAVPGAAAPHDVHPGVIAAGAALGGGAALLAAHRAGAGGRDGGTHPPAAPPGDRRPTAGPVHAITVPRGAEGGARSAAPHGDPAPRSPGAGHPFVAPHAAVAPRPSFAPRRSSEPRAASAPHPAFAQRPAVAPHPPFGPHPGLAARGAPGGGRPAGGFHPRPAPHAAPAARPAPPHGGGRPPH